MTLAMKSAATNTTSAVNVVFGEYEKVTGAAVGLRSATAVATKIAISGQTVVVTPATDPGTGSYDVIADCI